MQYHPWRRLRELVHVTLHWHDDGPAGWCRHSTQDVSIRRGMTQAERRSTVTHEVVHLERGPAVRGFSEREEREVDKEAARRLLPDIREVGEALAWASCVDEAADELWVDRGTLRARLEHLHPAERAYLRRRLADDDVHQEETA
ncbi:hypothetical protein GON03_19275 [Nocardioides sp. MAH-18]|uniref:ImmA/IrrE family metallo-endopeptidase n=1 Tax=Nocardioides agri TaxID=2682843 RepID=A0A6L6XXA3_9ACTN|nr:MULTISPECIES: hypothetical protein [unclassified Nocardioides]MBA2952161.1 hypothetical protein [Nocardioides sp. CGMCC 1.13656]MVQ51327.1 hypothetical protein [Nocardioides sp. MAH-18]